MLIMHLEGRVSTDRAHVHFSLEQAGHSHTHGLHAHSLNKHSLCTVHAQNTSQRQYASRSLYYLIYIYTMYIHTVKVNTQSTSHGLYTHRLLYIEYISAYSWGGATIIFLHTLLQIVFTLFRKLVLSST